MLKRAPGSGRSLVTLLLIVLVVAGCAKRIPLSEESEALSAQETSGSAPQESEEALAARQEREHQAAIEERERRVVEESMRRRFGEVPPPPAMTVAREEFLNQDVHFAYDSFTLSEEAKAILERKAIWLKENPQAVIQIEGHCDERGTTAYNLALGERRANAVKQYLVALGIEASRLTTISYGEEFPLDPGHNEAAWARNRRAHFIITKQ